MANILDKITEYIEGNSEESRQFGIADWEQKFFYISLSLTYSVIISFVTIFAFLASRGNNINDAGLWIGGLILSMYIPFLYLVSPFFIFSNIVSFGSWALSSFSRYIRWRIIGVILLLVFLGIPFFLNAQLSKKFDAFKKSDFSVKTDIKHSEITAVYLDGYGKSFNNQIIRCDDFCNSLMNSASIKKQGGIISYRTGYLDENDKDWQSANFYTYFPKDDAEGLRLGYGNKIVILEKDISNILGKNKRNDVVRRYEIFVDNGDKLNKIYQKTYFRYGHYFPLLVVGLGFPYPARNDASYEAKDEIRRQAQTEMLNYLSGSDK